MGLEKLHRLSIAMKNKPVILECRKALWNMAEAKRLMEAEGVFSVCSNGYREDVGKFDESFELLCATMEDVITYIASNDAYCDEDDFITWYDVEKWVKRDGEYQSVCTYYIQNGIIYYTELDCTTYGWGRIKDLFDGTNLNLPVPFKAGDILEVDRFPFCPPIHVMIMEIGDNRDCCCVQALSRGCEGMFYVAAVKHGMIGDFFHMMTSPLYTARRYDGILPDREKVIGLIKDYTQGDENRIREVAEWFWRYDRTEDEILESMKTWPEGLKG